MPAPERFLTEHHELGWRVHTANLMSEIMNNPETGILHVSIQIFSQLLCEVGERAAELHDPVLNALMMRLTIYEQADPTSKDYRPELYEEVLQEAAIARARELIREAKEGTAK